MVGGALAILGAENDPAWRTERDLLQRVGEVRHLHLGVLPAGCQQRRFVAQVGKVGADHARCRGRERVEVHVVCEQQRAGVDLEDLAVPGAVRRRHHDPAVKTPGT